MSLRALSRQLEMIPLAVAYCIGRGEAIARENGYRLIGKFFTFLRTSRSVRFQISLI